MVKVLCNAQHRLEVTQIAAVTEKYFSLFCSRKKIKTLNFFSTTVHFILFIDLISFFLIAITIEAYRIALRIGEKGE
jgi:hypothetical protein